MIKVPENPPGKPLGKSLGWYLEKAAEMIFPPKCIFCGSLLEPGSRYHICGSCHRKIPYAADGLIRLKASVSGGCDCAVCVCRYTGIIRESLLRFKFYNKPGYYRTFARLLADRLKEMAEDGTFDVIAAVPLYKARQRTRGFNQAMLLAGQLSRETGIPYEPELLSRIRDTGAQSLLAGAERERNVRDAFMVNPASRVNGRNVLLVDDVLTTGSTVNECGRVLKAAGAKGVTAVVIATGRK